MAQRGVWAEPTRSCLLGRGKTVLRGPQRKCLLAAWTGAYADGVELLRRGYNTDGKCSYCQGTDAVWRRVWQCPHGSAVRDHLPIALVAEAIAVGPWRPLFG